MASSGKGVYVDDYLEYSSTLPAELQRLLSTMRELDERAEGFISLAEDQTKYCVGRRLQSHSSKKASYEVGETELEKMKNVVEANQNNALNLCNQKVELAKQAYCLVERHMKSLDEDLNEFAENLKQEGEIPEDEPAIFPPLPLVIKEEERTGGYLTTQLKKNRERDRNRQKNLDLALMPPPRSRKKSALSVVDIVPPIDPNEPRYCVCNQVSYGGMIACDNENCKGGEWFHFSCVGLNPRMSFKGKWFCPKCRHQK